MRRQVVGECDGAGGHSKRVPFVFVRAFAMNDVIVVGGARYYRVEKVGEILGVSRRTVERYVSSGGLKAARVSGKLVVSEAGLREFLETPRPQDAVGREEPCET